MNAKLTIWLGAELLVAAVFAAGSCPYRQATTRALIAWRNDPTPENRTELDRQKAIDLKNQIGIGVFLFAGMATITIPLVVLSARRKSHLANRQTPAA